MTTKLNQKQIRNNHNKQLKLQWKDAGSPVGPVFKLRGIVRGSYVDMRWEMIPEPSWQRRPNQTSLKFKFEKSYGINYSRCFSGMQLGGRNHPYTRALDALKGNWEYWSQAYNFLNTLRDGTIVDGWMKTSLPFEEQETGPTTLHLWVELKTGRSLATRDVPFFGYYQDYFTPNGIC